MPSSDLEFEALVASHYAQLYRFALSLARNEADACDLTQQTFYLWAKKGHQLRDQSKAKSWLATTLYREFLGGKRRNNRFEHVSMENDVADLPMVEPDLTRELDGVAAMKALQEISEPYLAPLTLFYLQDLSYLEIAEVLEIPVGTVMSRLSRGKAELRKRLADRQGEFCKTNNITPIKRAAE